MNFKCSIKAVKLNQMPCENGLFEYLKECEYVELDVGGNWSHDQSARFFKQIKNVKTFIVYANQEGMNFRGIFSY